MYNFRRWTVTLITCLALSACNNHEDALENAEGFYVGARQSEIQAPDAYVLFDPLCSYCAEQWRNFQPLQSRVLVKWVPVGVLSENSVDLAAMLLLSEDPEVSMTDHLASVGSESTAVDAGEISEATRASVRQNNLVLNRLGTKSVPTIVYRDRSTGGVVVTSGVTTTSELASALGVGDIPADGE